VRYVTRYGSVTLALHLVVKCDLALHVQEVNLFGLISQSTEACWLF